MKKLFSTFALFAVTVSTAMAAESPDAPYSIGAGYGFGASGSSGVFSIRGDYKISDRVSAPLSVRVGFDRYTIDYGFSNYSWSYNVFYGGAYYDFGEMLKINSAIHPLVGLGFGFGSVSCSGSSFCNSATTPTVGGLYYIAGVQYDVTPNIAAELNYGGWTGISFGGAYRF